jgi:hypothetical protein
VDLAGASASRTTHLGHLCQSDICRRGIALVLIGETRDACDACRTVLRHASPCHSVPPLKQRRRSPQLASSFRYAVHPPA